MSSISISGVFHVQAKRSCWRPCETLEQVAAVALLAAASPVLLAAAAAVWVLSGKSPFIAHRRVGFQGAPLWVFKLRTMWDGHAKEPFRLIEYLQCEGSFEARKTQSDPRVTSKFAAFCRRYSIDELPQLWHVIRSELSLVGPRPITAVELETYYPDAGELLSVKPGLTGLWQTSGRSRLSYAQRKRLDLFLVRKFSPFLYARILFKTPACVLGGRGAW